MTGTGAGGTTAAEWALVTGASSGIGAAFAVELGRRGHPVALVSRSGSRMDELAARIETPTRVIPVDLTDPRVPTELATFVADPDTPVGLLVNCAGTAGFGPFVDRPEQQIVDTVQVNLTALMTLTRAVLSGMLERGRGGVVNISSSASDTPAPDAAVYAATKAAVDSFSRSLRWEVGPHGIVVTCVRPGYTRTPFLAGDHFDLRSVEELVQEPEDVVMAALLGHEAGRAVISVPPPRLRDRVRRHVGPLRRRVPPRVMALLDRSGIT